MTGSPAILRAGAAALDITPPLGLDLAGGAFGPATSILHPLQAKALFIDNGAERVLLLACDLLGFDWDYSQGIRREMAAKYGLAVDGIMLTCTHTHCGPATCTLRNWGTPDEDYCATLRAKLVQVAGNAVNNARGAAIAAGTIACPGAAANRSSGGTTTNDQLGVIKVTGDDGVPLAIVVNFACHPVNLHSSGAVTPDFPYYVEQDIRTALHAGVPVLYISGACGDLNPANFRFDPNDEKAKMTGAVVSARALELLGRLDRSMPPSLAFAAVNVRVDFQPLPATDDLERIIEERTAALARTEDKSATSWEYTGHKTNIEWAREALAVKRDGAPETGRDIPLQAMRVGQVLLVGIPGELFSEFGERIVASAPNAHVLTATLANGCFGYFATRAAYEHGAYEATGCPKFLGTYLYQADTGERICRGAVELISRL